MKIFLVRHGVKEKILGDPGLSGVGILQAKSTGNNFSLESLASTDHINEKNIHG